MDAHHPSWADPSSAFDPVEAHAQVPGRPSRKATEAILRAHVDVIGGETIKEGLARALASSPKLGGQERRYAAFAVRELSRHLRRIDALARTLGQVPQGLGLPQDIALVRYVVWRRFWTNVDWRRIEPEVKLPGPLRPRSVPDRVLASLLQPLPPPTEASGSAVDVLAARHSFPRWLADGLARAANDDLGDLLAALNVEPRLFLRGRPPGQRDELLRQLLAEGVEAQAVGDADAIAIVGEGRAVFDTTPMRAGRFQVMDVGSQRIVELCRVRKGMRVVDHCAGAGGKALHLADLGAEVFAHDTSSRRLKEAKRRASALGIRRVHFTEDPPLATASVVLLDVPCSGTGVLAREPEQKWKLSPTRVADLVAQQREIARGVVPRLKPGAALVYATCSLLVEEGEDQVQYLLEAFPELRLEQQLRTWPHRDGAGGFFGARLRRR